MQQSTSLRFTLFTIFFYVGFCSYAQTSKVEILSGSKAELVNSHLEELQLKGLSGSIIVEEKGKVTLKAGYGYANREKQIPFTPKTISTIGSITKPLTATAIMHLESQSRLKLSDPISKFMQGLSPHLQSITIEQLLKHQSGLGSILVGNDFKVISKADFLERLYTLKLKFSPGTKVSYSNIGYTVLAFIIEEISGMSYEAFMQTNFFSPLGMSNTGYVEHAWSEDELAIGYRGTKPWGVVHQKIKAMDGKFWNLLGNGGIHTNIDDIYLWYRAMHGSDVIPKELMSKMIEPHVKCGPKSITCFQGYAWVALYRNDGEELVGITHSGGNNILYADFWWYPEEEIFVFMMTNNSKFPAEDMLPEIRSILRK